MGHLASVPAQLLVQIQETHGRVTGPRSGVRIQYVPDPGTTLSLGLPSHESTFSKPCTTQLIQEVVAKSCQHCKYCYIYCSIAVWSANWWFYIHTDIETAPMYNLPLISALHGNKINLLLVLKYYWCFGSMREAGVESV